MIDVLIKKDKFGHRDTHTQGKHHMNKNAEIMVMCLQDTEYKKFPASHQKLGARPGIDPSLLPAEVAWLCQHTDLGFCCC